MADIFISYSKARTAETIALAAALEGKGFTVWWDSDITAGESYGEVILAELAKARAAIVIWTPASVKSKWVISEAGRADRLGILISVRSDDLKPEDIPPPFDVVHTELCRNVPAIMAALAKKGISPTNATVTTSTNAAAVEQLAAPGSVPRLRIVPSRRTLLLGGGATAAGGVAAAYAFLGGKQESDPDSPIRESPDENSWITSVAYTLDGRNVMLGCWDGTLKLRNQSADQWKVVRSFDGHSGQVWCMAMLPDGRHALTGSQDRTLRLWDFASSRPVRTYVDHQDEIYSVSVLPDGKRALSASLDRSLKLWDLASEKVIHTFPYESRVLAVAIAPNGEVAVSAAKDKLQAWSISGLNRLHAFERQDGFEGHTGDVATVAIAPNGTTVVSGGTDGTVQLWELSTGRGIRVLTPSHQKRVTAVAVSSDGRLVFSGSEDDTAKLWNLASGKLLWTFRHGQKVHVVALAPDGRTGISGGGDKKIIKMWNLSAISFDS